MFIGAPSSSVAGNFGSGSGKWNVEHFRTSEGRAKCAASIIKDNNLNKIPERVFEAVPNIRKGPNESMPEFYARKYPHASLLFSDPVFQSAVLMAYVKNSEAPNTHVHLAMASVAPCMTPEQQDAVVEQMGFESDNIFKEQPSRAFVLRFMHDISEVNQNFLATKIAGKYWGTDEAFLGYVCENANMFSSARAKACLVEAIYTGQLKFESANAKKMLVKSIYDGHFGDDPNLLAKITGKLEDLFGASGVDETSIGTYLETLSILAQAVGNKRLGVDTEISQFQLAEIKKLFAQQASPDMKRALADAICRRKFGDALEVRQMLVDNLPLFATNVADLESENSFDKHLNALHGLAKFVFDQGFGKDREILKKLAENLKIFIVDLELFSAANLRWFDDSRINGIRNLITRSIASGKFKGMAPGDAALKQLEKFKADIPGYTWNLAHFTGLGLVGAVSASHTAMDVDQPQIDTLSGRKRGAGEEVSPDPKRPKGPVSDGRPRPPMGLLAGIRGGMQLKSTNKGSNDSAPVRGKVTSPVSKPPKKGGLDLSEIQKKARERAARAEEKASNNEVAEQPVTNERVPQTPTRVGFMEELSESKIFLSARMGTLRKQIDGTPKSKDSTPSSNDSTPGKWHPSPQNEGQDEG